MQWNHGCATLLVWSFQFLGSSAVQTPEPEIGVASSRCLVSQLPADSLDSEIGNVGARTEATTISTVGARFHLVSDRQEVRSSRAQRCHVVTTAKMAPALTEDGVPCAGILPSAEAARVAAYALLILHGITRVRCNTS